MEQRPSLEFKGTFLGAVNVTTSNICRQQVGCKLDAVKVSLKPFRERLDGFGFCQAGRAFNQKMAVRKQRNHKALNKMFLTDNSAA